MRQGDLASVIQIPGTRMLSLLPDASCRHPANGLPMDTLTGRIFARPNAVDMLNAYVPYPNNASTATWQLRAFYELPQEAIRVDQNINVKTTLFVRFTQDSWNRD